MAISTSKVKADEILKSNKEELQELIESQGVKDVRKLLKRSERELNKRLKALAPSMKGSFTEAKLRSTLVQIQLVLRQLNEEMQGSLVKSSSKVSQKAVRQSINYLKQADASFTGMVQPLNLDEANLFSEAESGVKRTILRRLSVNNEGGERTRDVTALGILDRYGLETISLFEQRLQQAVLQNKSFDEMQKEITSESIFLQQKPAFWAERIVRTELLNSANRANWEAQKSMQNDLEDMVKILSATFDSRSAADSYAVHGQIRRPDEPFDTWYGQMQHPPARPNDREIVVPHRLSWGIPVYLKPKTKAQILARWRKEGHKKPIPPIPKRSTL